MQCVIVSFTLDGIEDEEFRVLAEGVAPAFAGIPGLVSKAWTADPVAGEYGGVYLFATEADADAYLASPLFAEAVAGNPRFADVSVRRLRVLAGPTAVTTPGAAGVPA